MGKRGPKPKGKIKIKWSANFAYAIGLLVTDGNLSPDKRHLNFTSKDKEQIDNFQICLGIDMHVGRKARGGNVEKKYFVVQFGDVLFYQYLLNIGLSANKSRKLGKINIPNEYFFDFLRGHFDGDGSFYSYFDPRWKSSFMFYLEFISASRKHIFWLRKEIKRRLNVRGHLTNGTANNVTIQLKYAKRESLKIIKSMYYSKSVTCLSRKLNKIERALKVAGIDK